MGELMTGQHEVQRDVMPRVYTGAQQLLRFVSWLYIAWCVVTTAGSVLVGVTAFFSDRVSDLPEGGARFVMLIVSAATFFVSAAINFFIAIFAARCAVHPRLARAFRIVTIVLIVINVAALGVSVFSRQFSGVLTNIYALFISGLLCYLATQIAREHEAGEAVDKVDLPRTAMGKLITSKRKLERAIDQGVLARSPRNQEI